MKKKITSKPKQPIPIPSDLEEFQAAYGSDWLAITQSPAFMAGMQLLNVRKFKGITLLSNDEIEKHSREILSNLIGQLQHEEELFTLHSKTDFQFPVEEQDEYMSPEQAAEMETLVAKFREERKRERYGQ